MTTLVKIQRKGQMTLPTQLRAAIGIEEGDLVEARLHRGRIVITRKPEAGHPLRNSAADEPTPAQRRIIDARLDKAEADLRAGRVSPAYASPQEFLRDLHRKARRLKKAE